MVERLAPIIAAEPLTELWPTICSLSTRAQPARALVFDLAGAILAQASQQLRQSHLQSGWVEHDPMGIWSSPRHIAERAVQQARVSPHDIRVISITNQRETALLWERASGPPVYNAIVWRCRRSTSQCERLVVQGLAPEVHSRTGLVIDAYFSATKLLWLFEHIPGLR